MSERVKLPIWGSVKLAFEWSIVICRRHWRLIAIYILAGWVLSGPWTSTQIGFDPWNVVRPAAIAAPMHFQPLPVWSIALVVGLVVAFLLLISVPLIVLALISHNEVLRGRAGFDAETLGRGPGRILGYLFDLLRIVVVTILAVLLVMLGIALLGALVRALRLPDWMFAVAAMGAIWLALVAIQARLLLRLPGRALGQVLSWGEVQRMGRGNTLRLVGAHLLVWLVFIVPLATVMAPVMFLYASGWPPFSAHFPTPTGSLPTIPAVVQALVAFLNSIISTFELVVYCAFLSVVYGRLLPVLDEPDPSLPPMA
ncbi:hypothetical protein [Xanthobacter sp. 126]|uniref:hypothetical protein n=1 Tax=Xanthobacter sp. 126 TaxID=1131814 RepID=UPI00045E8D35|nr:hypothetical protein [Xanthobacter sp. 126]